MTSPLYLSDPYAQNASATVLSHTAEGGVVLDQSIFYPTGGGQPGDSGSLAWDEGTLSAATTVKGENGAIVILPAEAVGLPPVGARVQQRLDWDRRFAHMRVHTALHLLSVVMPFGVTGGSIGAGKGRLDFDMAEAPEDKAAVEDRLNALVEQDLPVDATWITEEALDANPQLVKTLSVQPPRGAGRVRLVRIGPEDAPVDLQPCGGTHVARTSEIGPLRIGKIEKKGRQNRRVYLHLAN